jgi:hypothetical protein
MTGRWTPGFLSKLSTVSREVVGRARDRALAAGATWNDLYEVCRMRHNEDLDEAFEVTLARYLHAKTHPAKPRKDAVDPFAPEETVREAREKLKQEQCRAGRPEGKPFDPDEVDRDARHLHYIIQTACADRGNHNYIALLCQLDPSTGKPFAQVFKEMEKKEHLALAAAAAIVQLLALIPAERLETVLDDARPRCQDAQARLDEADAAADALKQMPLKIETSLEQASGDERDRVAEYLSNVKLKFSSQGSASSRADAA